MPVEVATPAGMTILFLAAHEVAPTYSTMSSQARIAR
jgi:hypothetical protein